MLTTRVIPTSGGARGSVDVIAQPALAKQLIGVVSQQNTLDRQLTVWENLYFHGRLFGIGAASRARPPIACSSSSGCQLGEGVRVRAVGRDGAAADGRPRDLPPAGGAVPRRADGGARSAEPARVVGDPRRAHAPARRSCSRPLHGGGRPALRPSRDHGPRQDPRARYARRAEALGRRRHDRDRQGIGRCGGARTPVERSSTA